MKSILLKTYTLILCTLFCANSFAADGVAKIMIAKGKVFDLSKKKELKKGDWVDEGAQIQTKERSFVKLIFIDKSIMSLGPASQMEVAKFPKDKAGVITLLKGQLRSQVTKNYMEMDKSKSKLFIKTRTAAMGVRGTDFQVNYNPENMNTSLITFEGAVRMGAINNLKSKFVNQDRLERIVSDSTSVMVTRGTFSGVMPGIDSKPVAPVKINTLQLKALEKNDGSIFNGGTSDKPKESKPISKRSIIPPGVNSTSFQGASKAEVLKEIAKIDPKTAGTIQSDIKKENTKSPTEGQKASALTNAKFKDGGLVNTEVVAYIAPPKNAAIDPMTKEAIIPVAMGGFDSGTGNYKNDYFTIDKNLNWVPIEQVVKTDPTGRLPASTNPEPAPAPNPVAPPPPVIGSCDNCDVKPPEYPIGEGPEINQIDSDKITEDAIGKVEDTIDQQQSSSTKTKVIFKAQ